ncbi:MAG: hypothetical protein C0408_02045 [Odoribacter sp.]|nr:hypothetical protein [Odoribacter sp.]
MKMKKILFLLLVICLVRVSLTAQEFSKEFRVIGQNEINLTKYSKDPEAEAVVLFDIGESRFIDKSYGYDIEFTRTKRIKILSRPGIKYSEVSIPFYADGTGKTETVISVEAYSYNFENGQLVKNEVNPGSVFVEKIDNRWNTKKFVFPDVKSGTIIEFRYVLLTPFHFNLPDWEFQSRIPTVYSNYTARMIPFYEYVFIAQGITRFDYQNSAKDSKKRSFGAVNLLYGQNVGSGVEFQDMIHTYTMKNVPAFKDESYITSVSDYLMKMDFQLAKFYSPQGGETEIISTWSIMVQDLLKYENFGKYLKEIVKPAKKILETEINIANLDNLEKCRQIISYVKSAYGWDERSSVYASKSPKEFLNQKKGNSADINLFLIALLRSAGIDANPVIISTRDHGKIRIDYPFISFFNYVIVIINVDNHVFLTDGTEIFLPFNRIPPRCINERGLIINETKEGWVNLNLDFSSIDDKAVTMIINPETFKAKTTLTIQASDFDSFWYKKSFLNDSVKLKKHITEMGITETGKIKTHNYERTDRPYIIMCEGETEVEQLNNKIIVSPFLNFFPKENIFTQLSRSYPIDFTYANIEKYRCTIEIPLGYRVLSIPEGYKTGNELFEMSIDYKESDRVIEIATSYRFKKAVYQPAEYTRVKTHMDTIVKKFSDQIIFEKI